MASFEAKHLVNSGRGACVHHPPCRGPEAHGRLRLQQAHQGCCLCRAGCCWGLSTPGPMLFGPRQRLKPSLTGIPARCPIAPPDPHLRRFPAGCPGAPDILRVAPPRLAPPAGWRRSSGSAEEQVRGKRAPRPPAQPMRLGAGTAGEEAEGKRPAGGSSLRSPSGPEAERDAKLRPAATGTQARPRRRRRRICLPFCGEHKLGDARAGGEASARRRRGRLLLVDREASLPSRGRVPAAPPRSVPLSFRSESTAVMQAARIGSARLCSRFPQSAAAAAGPISRAALP